ncbi:hypothetical protein [Actinomadura sp. 7K534]|nr:hypothetical protein [Actinomadura sp. 7K534]
MIDWPAVPGVNQHHPDVIDGRLTTSGLTDTTTPAITNWPWSDTLH